MKKAIGACLHKYASWDYTATKGEFWWFQLFYWAGTGILTLTWWPVGVAWAAIFYLPNLAVGARRLQDAGYAGEWTVGLPILPLILGGKPTRIEGNKYRADAFCPHGHAVPVDARWCLECQEWLPGFQPIEK